MKNRNNSNFLSNCISKQDSFEDIELVESTTDQEAFITEQNNFLGWIILILLIILLTQFL